MIRFDELLQRAIDAGFDAKYMGESQISVDEPHSHWSTPHEWVYFDNVGGYAVPFLATSQKFERKVLKDVGCW